MGKKIVLFLVMMVGGWLSGGAKEYKAYLFAYFTGNDKADESIHFAISYDGYHYRALNGNRPVIASEEISSTGGVRDPHILRSEDGKTFYMVVTDMVSAKGWDSNRAMVLLKSTDLIHWTSSVVNMQQKGFAGYDQLKRVWAPQTIYDAKARKYMIYWSMKFGDGPDRIYYAYANPDFTDIEGEPKPLFLPASGKSCIDGDIVRHGGKYHLFYKTEGHGNGIKKAVTKSLTSGKWKEYDEYLQQTDQAVEGSSVFPLIGTDKYILMYDVYMAGKYQFTESTDLSRFRVIDGEISMDFHPRHGTVIPITAAEAARLEQRWGKEACERLRRLPLDSIRLSDPCILADSETQMYYMTGTGGMLWKSKDLKCWEGPYRVTETDPESWMGPDPEIWAAEIHAWQGKYYYFATFTNKKVKIDTVRGNAIERRASHVLVSDYPDGPYRPMLDPVYLPAGKPTLDGTFWVDCDGKPYMVYCHEWLQNWNGTIEKIELKPDLSGSVGEGKILFRASDSPWSREKNERGEDVPNKVTDGPYLFRTGTGRLGMIWTSWIYDVYTQGVAYSESGTLDGPWVQEKEPITPPDYGHGMLFQTFEGKWLMSLHSHRNIGGYYLRIPHLFEVDLSGDKLIVKPLQDAGDAITCYEGWELVWNDEFGQEGRLDEKYWGYENGFQRNKEHQWYQPENAYCKDGLLIIEGRREQRPNPLYQPGSKDWRKSRPNIGYTSSSVNTHGKKEFQYGRFEVRAKIPTAGGAWPAIWTLGTSMEWPSCGEIDVMEYYRIGGVPHILANAAWGKDNSWDAEWNSAKIPFQHFLDKDPHWAEKFHVWRMDWDEEAIRLYLDGELLNEIFLSSTANGSAGQHRNPFRQPHYLLLNLAIGGINGGTIDDTAFPMRYEIDYVRVYQKKK